MKRYFICFCCLVNAICCRISLSETRFEMNKETNQMFSYINIAHETKKMLIDTGSYITWIKSNSTKAINCFSHFECLTNIPTSNNSSSSLMVKYETGLVLLIPQLTNLTNVIAKQNPPHTIELTIGIAQYIDINTYNSFDGILGFGKSNTVFGANDSSHFDSILDRLPAIDKFSFDFTQSRIIFWSSKIIREKNRECSFYPCDQLVTLWEVVIKKFSINDYDICNDYRRYYSKCSIIIDSGTQYFSFQKELLPKANKAVGTVSNPNDSIIKIELETNDILTIESIYFIKEETSPARLKSKRKVVLFHENSLKKIVLGINFLIKYPIIFDTTNQGIWITKLMSLHSNNSNNNNNIELKSLIKRWNKIT